jgi:hypothetical protein
MTVVRLSSSKLTKLLLLAGVAGALIALPAGIDGGPGIAWHSALAKNDGGGGNGNGGAGGHGGGNGGGHGNGRSGEHGQAANAKPGGDAGFKNHGERTKTMVELAKRLGYGARVGAMQAKFGTPFENGIAELQAQLAEARARGDQAEVDRLEAELADAIARAKPGKGPNDTWATADLDVNDDGVVDRRDLDALDQR